MNKYYKFQFGWVIVITFLAAIIFITVAYIYQWGNNPIDSTGFIAFLVIFGGVFLTFYGITVVINENQILIKFGIGLFRKRIDLSSVRSVKVIKYPAYVGYGIRIIQNGILYNVSGKYAVELRFKNRKKVIMIGTEDGENLKAVIENLLKPL
jgi:hypothetical protein